MEVYLLYAHVEVDRDILLGVYHTKEDALFHKDELDRKSMEDLGFIEFDEYNIQKRVIGARASTHPH